MYEKSVLVTLSLIIVCIDCWLAGHTPWFAVNKHFEITGEFSVEPGNAKIRLAGWYSNDEAAREHTLDRLSLLLKLVASGDKLAVSEVYRLTSGRLYALLLQMLPNQGDADDVLQEAFLTIWQKARSYKPEQVSPMTWLITITRDKAIERLQRDKSGQKGKPHDSRGIEAFANMPSALSSTEISEEHQRDVIRTAFFSGVTYQELAERASVPPGTMKSWIRQGLLRLKACLEA